jgi:uncharacterized RDD family membrane protein YckC
MEMVAEQAHEETLYGRYAGFVTRLFAYMIDALIVTVILATTAAVAGFMLEYSNAGRLTERIVIFGILAFDVIFYLGYYVGLWLLAGQTPGKRIMGVRIVRTDGGRLTFGNAVRRLVGYWLSTFAFLGYLWILADNRRQGWHDKLAGTMVIYAWPEVELATPIRDRVQRVRRERWIAGDVTE